MRHLQPFAPPAAVKSGTLFRSDSLNWPRAGRCAVFGALGRRVAFLLFMAAVLPAMNQLSLTTRRPGCYEHHGRSNGNGR